MNARELSRRGYRGFTIAELIVVIAVLSILISISVIYLGDWRSRTAANEVKDNLTNAAAAMENARNFGTGYPAALPASFTASSNVTVQLKTSTPTSYCINGQNIARSEVKYYITAQSSPVAGSCP